MVLLNWLQRFLISEAVGMCAAKTGWNVLFKLSDVIGGIRHKAASGVAGRLKSAANHAINLVQAEEFLKAILASHKLQLQYSWRSARPHGLRRWLLGTALYRIIRHISTAQTPGDKTWQWDLEASRVKTRLAHQARSNPRSFQKSYAEMWLHIEMFFILPWVWKRVKLIDLNDIKTNWVIGYYVRKRVNGWSPTIIRQCKSHYSTTTIPVIVHSGRYDIRFSFRGFWNCWKQISIYEWSVLLWAEWLFHLYFKVK